MEEVAPNVWLGPIGYEIHWDGEVYTTPDIANLLGMESMGVIKRLRRYRTGQITLADVFAPRRRIEEPVQPVGHGMTHVPVGMQSRHEIDPLWRRALCESRRSHAAHERC